jgi:hypothetical protein
MDDYHSIFPRKNGEADFDFYPYNPSNVAGYVFMAIFAVGSVVHLGYIIPYRTWYCIPFLLGCIGKSTTPPSHDRYHILTLSQPKQEATTAAPGHTTTAA